MKKIPFLMSSVCVLSLVVSGCMGSKKAYQKSKLSGFVGDQTQLLIDENNIKTNKGDNGIGKIVEETKVKVIAIDADLTKANAVIAELEQKMDVVEGLEKEVKAEFERSNVSTVFFGLNKSELNTASMQELYRWKMGIDRSATAYNFGVVVYSSADQTGSEKGNAALREKRATAVNDFLVNSLGVPAAKVQIVTTQPAYTGANNLDRRVVVGVVVK